jgi:hypothetical protein
MSDQPPVPIGPRRGLLAAAPYATAFGLIAIIWLAVMRSRQTEDGPLDLLTVMIALAVGLTVFSALWWAVTSRGGRDLAAWWDADEATAHVHLPIWGTAILVTSAYLFFYTWLEDRLGAFGVILVTCVLQLIVMNIVGHYLARRLERGGASDSEVSSTLKWALSTVGWPMILYLIVLLILEIPVLTGSTGGDFALALCVFTPLLLLMLYVGFAIVYGAGEGVERMWSALFSRGGQS